MHGLRSKLLLGFGGMLLIVLLTSIVSETVMVRYSQAIRRSYREDYDSVAACQHMKEAVESMDLLASESSWSGPVSTSEYQRFRTEFELQLELQRKASTLPGERDATEQL